MIFVVINQTNKHKAKIYSQYKYTQIIMKVFINIKKFSSKYKNGKFIIKLKLIAKIKIMITKINLRKNWLR